MEFSKHILSSPAWIQSLVFSDVIWRCLEYQSDCCKYMTEVLCCWCCIPSRKCPFGKSVVWRCLFKSSVFIRLWYHSTVWLLCLHLLLFFKYSTAAIYKGNIFLSSAGLLMTGVWSSPILETWPTLLKSSEVRSNVVHSTIEYNSHKHWLPYLFRLLPLTRCFAFCVYSCKFRVLGKPLSLGCGRNADLPHLNMLKLCDRLPPI